MINVEKFLHSPKIYEVHFHEILKYIIKSYELLIKDNVQLENNENAIRDILVENYLTHSVKREKMGIGCLIFNREPAENMAKGFVDIKVQTMISLNNPKAYYIFECKRLDGSSALNKKYIKDGIMRFICEKYSSYYGLNGMLGFEVRNFNTLDNIKILNRLVFSKYPEVNCVKKIAQITILENFKYSYISENRTVSSGKVQLYHLMLDFSYVVTR
jgi:hypothetical protein